MSRIRWCEEMRDPARPLSQRTLRPLTDEEAARVYAGIVRERARRSYAIAEQLAHFAEAMAEGERRHRAALADRRTRLQRLADRIGTACGVLVLAVVAYLCVAGVGGWE